MSLPNRMLKQLAVYWEPTGTDRHGRATFATGEYVKVRWTTKQETFLAANGKEEISKAVVFLGLDPKLDGVLWLGDKANLTVEQLADPLNELEGAFVVRAISSVRGLRKSLYVRKAWL